MERRHAWTLRRSPALRKSRAPFLWTQTWGGYQPHGDAASAEGACAPPPVGRHTSPSRFACHLSSRRGFGVRRLKGQAPLEGSCQPKAD